MELLRRFEWEINEEWSVYAEGSWQDGSLLDGRDIRAMPIQLGVEWDVGGENNAIVGLQYDYKSGDSNPNSGDYENFIAPGRVSLILLSSNTNATVN